MLGSKRSEAGFTLLEVMVALLIFALAVLSLSESIGASAAQLSALEQRHFAAQIADNQLAEAFAIDDAKGLKDGRNGEVDMAGQRYRWRLSLQSTENPQVARFSVTVRDEGGELILAERHAFVEATTANGGAR